MSKIKSRLSYANVMATIAVFLALGGVATAALTVPKKSVGPKQLKANAVTEPKIAGGAVTSSKIGASAITADKIAGGQVVKNVVARETVVANQGSGTFTVRDLQCNAGEQAVGGGVDGTTVGTRNFPNLDIDTAPRAFGPIDANGSAVANGQVATGWHLSAQVVTGPRDLHFYVLCGQR